MMKYSKEETDSGTDLIKEFLDTWKSRIEVLEREQDGEVKEDRQVQELRAVAKEFEGRLDANKWIEGLMLGL